MKILDLGAGTGYLTFAIAKRFPDVTIIGLDIVEKAFENNRRRATDEKLENIYFRAYEGITFPFADNSFDMVVSRYALHHFPNISASLSEIARVLTVKGCLFICDPTPNEIDKGGFVDEYMQVKPDGHIRFYSSEEWEKLCSEFGLLLKDFFTSSIRFPRKMEQAYLDIMQKYDREIVESYDMKILDDEIFVTEQVNNMLFCKGQS